MTNSYSNMTTTQLQEHYNNVRTLYFNATQMRKRNISDLHYEIEDIEQEFDRRHKASKADWRVR